MLLLASGTIRCECRATSGRLSHERSFGPLTFTVTGCRFSGNSDFNIQRGYTLPNNGNIINFVRLNVVD